MLLSGLPCLLLGLLPLGAFASLDNGAKIANRTLERTVSLRTHSVYAPYIDQDLQNRWWDFGADTIINTNKHIRLTRNKPSQMGWIWSRLPLTAANFVVEFEFKISGDSSHLFGDGMAFWLTTDRAKPGPIFGSIDEFDGLAVFLDTYANSRHTYSFPRVVGMLGNGKTKYDQANDGEANKIGACSANFRRTNVATKLKITYIKDTYLNVQMQYRAWDEWTECFTVHGITLPTAPYIGISAMTGDVSDNHDVIAVTTHSAILSSPDAQRDQFRNNKPTDAKSSSWLSFFLKFLLFGAVLSGIWYGYTTYVLKQGGRGLGSGLGSGLSRSVPSLGGAFYDSKRF